NMKNLGLILLAVGVAIVVLGYLLGGESAARRWTFWALGATLLGAGGGCLAGNAYTEWAETQKAAAHGHDHEGHDHDQHAEAGPAEAPHAEATTAAAEAVGERATGAGPEGELP